jgi:putative alpha-1,2-mannosidase
MAPEVAADLAMSLVAMASQVGKSILASLHKEPLLQYSHLRFHQNDGLPRWPIASTDANCMTGAHGVVIMADAVVKGVTGIDSV